MPEFQNNLIFSFSHRYQREKTKVDECDKKINHSGKRSTAYRGQIPLVSGVFATVFSRCEQLLATTNTMGKRKIRRTQSESVTRSPWADKNMPLESDNQNNSGGRTSRVTISTEAAVVRSPSRSRSASHSRHSRSRTVSKSPGSLSPKIRRNHGRSARKSRLRSRSVEEKSSTSMSTVSEERSSQGSRLSSRSRSRSRAEQLAIQDGTFLL